MKQENDDVLCTDYGFIAETLNTPDIYRQKLNKDLVHISYSRLKQTLGESGWNKDLLLVPILRKAHEFLVSLSKCSQYPSNFEQRRLNLLKQIEEVVPNNILCKKIRGKS
jgi:hypothetical protein